jgi:hypothetical protein
MPLEPPDELEIQPHEPADFRQDRLLAELIEDSQRLSEALRFLREGVHDRSVREALRKAELEVAKAAVPGGKPEEQNPLVADEDQQLEAIAYLLKHAVSDVAEARKSIAETAQKLRGGK